MKKRNKFYMYSIVLFVLSAFDAVFTHIGLEYIGLQELNPLVLRVYETSIFLFYLWKLLLPAILIYLSPRIQPKPIFNFLFIGSLIVYSLIFIYHVFWMSLYISI